MRIARPFLKILNALGQLTAEQPEPPDLPALTLVIIPLENALGWSSQNRVAELTNVAAGTFTSFTVDEDAFYRIWFDIVNKTGTAAPIRVGASIGDESGNSILQFGEAYIKNAMDNYRVAAPGVLLWMKKNWSVNIGASTATGIGETIRQSLNVTKVYQA